MSKPYEEENSQIDDFENLEEHIAYLIDKYDKDEVLGFLEDIIDDTEDEEVVN